MGIANDTRELDPPLKGANDNNRGGGSSSNWSNNNSADTHTSSSNSGGGGSDDKNGEPGPLSGVRWRVLRVARKIDSARTSRAHGGEAHKEIWGCVSC